MTGQVPSYSTVENIRTRVLRRSGNDVDTNIEVLSEDSFIDEMDHFQRLVWDAPYTETVIGSDSIRPSMKGWSFTEDERVYTSVSKTTLSADYTAGGSSVSISSGTDFDSTNGAFVVYSDDLVWEVGKFATRSSGTLSTVTELNSNFTSGDDVYKLFALPSDYAKAKWMRSEDVEYDEVSEDPRGAEFATVPGFLWLPKDVGSGKTFGLRYTKKMTQITTITTTLSTPKEFDDFYVHMMLALFYVDNGNPQGDVDRSYRAAYNILNMRMGYDVKSANRRIRLLRLPPQSPDADINPDPDFNLT